MHRDLLVMLLLAMVCLSCGGTKPAKNEPAPAGPRPSPEPGGDLRPVIVAFGDSLTAGAGVDPGRNYPSKLQAKIDAGAYGYRVVNAGVSGDTTSQGLDRLEPVVSLHPALVIVEFGANDGLRGVPVETIRLNLEAIIKGLQAAGAKVVLAGMEIPPNYGPQYTRSFRSIFPALAGVHHVSLIPFFLDRVGGRPELNQEDGIHPTAQGYDIVVENVWKVLRPLL